MLDTLIVGTNSEHVQSKRIQRDETLSLDEAIDIARTEEATKQQLQSLKTESNIHAMSNRRPQATCKPWHNATNYSTTHYGRSTQNQRYSSKPQQYDTAHCSHWVDDVGDFLHKCHRRMCRIWIYVSRMWQSKPIPFLPA